MSTGLQDRFSYVMKSFAKKERKEKPELLEENPDTEIVDELPRKDSHFKRVKGSDPCAATCRGKLQYRRSKLNQEINKHLMLRQGAENLLRAAENKRVRHATSLELSFVNSNLQYLKEELSDLNSSVEIYQSESKSPHIPMIPFGLKETKYINFTDVFKDYIQEHYSEDSSQYIGAIQDLVDLRQAIRTPQRCEAGVDLLFQYYNQLYFIERRFFPPDRHLGIHFEWFDSLTGLPSCQRTVAFEKASVLFNMAALYSQIAAKQNRERQEQLDCAVDNYLRAAGIYRYIVDNFSNAPSRDLHPDVLEVLSTLLLTQAGECLLEKLLVVSTTDESRQLDLIRRLEVAQEAAQMSNQYQQLTEQMSQPAIESSIPASWLQLVRIKSVYYLALAHHHFALGLIEHEGPMSRRAVDILHVSQTDRHNQIARVENKVPRNTPQKNYLGKCHLREAISQHEEAHRLYRMSRELKKGEVVIEVLKDAMDVSSERYELISHEDEFNAPVDPPLIIGCSKYQIELTCPEFGQHPVSDLFRDLGPLEVFNAHHHWSAPRQVLIDRSDGQGLGFSVKMEAPVVVVGVEPDSLAEMVGLKEGDYIVGIDDQSLKWSSHTEVVSLIRRAGSRFSMVVVTPMDKPPSESESPQPPLIAPSISDKSWGSLSSSGVSSNESATSGSGSRKPSPSSTLTSQHGKWNPFKKSPGSSSHYITAHPTETR